MSSEGEFNADFLDILDCMAEASVKFVIVGAHAMAAHGVPRATGDLDLFVRPDEENAKHVMEALRSFGAPIEAHGVEQKDFEAAGAVYQIGLPPKRIDILTKISGVSFDEAWASRLEAAIADRRVAFLGREALIANKRAAGRDKDLLDVKTLENQRPRK